MNFPHIMNTNFITFQDIYIFLIAPQTVLPRVDFGVVSTDNDLHIKVTRNDDLICILFIY